MHGANVGRVGILGIDATTNQAVCYLIPEKDKADSRYIFHALQQKLPEFISRSVGGAQPNISQQIIRETEVLLPPIAQQKRIAAILDKAEELRSLRRKTLGELDAIAPSIFLEMFGDAVKNDRNWQTAKMGDLLQIRRGASPRPIEKYLGGDVNWIKIGDGTKGSDIHLESCADKITYDGSKKSVFLKSGNLIFANCGVSLGFARILKVDGCIHDGWLSFEDIPKEKLDKLFLLKALNSITQHFRDIAPAGTQPNLNTGLMKNFRVILPPLPLQQEFARRVDAIERLKTTHRESLAQLDTLFAIPSSPHSNIAPFEDCG